MAPFNVVTVKWEEMLGERTQTEIKHGLLAEEGKSHIDFCHLSCCPYAVTKDN